MVMVICIRVELRRERHYWDGVRLTQQLQMDRPYNSEVSAQFEGESTLVHSRQYCLGCDGRTTRVVDCIMSEGR